MKKENSPKLKQEIQAAQTFLSNLKTESQVALQRRNQIRLDTEAETKKLLDKRKAELDKFELDSKTVLEKLEDKAEGIKREIGNLEFNKDSLNTKIAGKITELDALHKSLGDVKTIIEAENSKITTLVSQQKGIQGSIDTLKEQITPLQQELSELKPELADLRTEKNELLVFIKDKTDEFQADKEVSERDLSILNDQKTAVKTQIKDSQDQMKAERDDLASRKLAADQRDDNLRRREYKVSRDEQMVAQNAGLLNL